MFKNKLVNTMVIILIVLTLIGAITFAVVWYLKKDQDSENREPTIDEILERSVEVEELTTNLKDDSFIVIKLRIQTDSEDAKKELEKRSFQVNNILIEELASMPSEKFRSKEGLREVEELFKTRINELMQEGNVVKVYITNRIIQ